MHYHLLRLIGLIALAVVSSCSPVIYTTLQPVTLLPEKKGDVELTYGNTIYSSAYDGNFGVSLTGACALTDRYSITANYLGWRGDVDINTLTIASVLNFESWGSNANIFEVGVGRYWVNRTDNNWRYEVTAGYGMGFINNERQDAATTDARYVNFYAQPALGYKSKHLWLITALRFTHINYRSLDWQYPNSLEERTLASFYDDHKQTLAIEPGISASLHFDPILVSAKYAWSSFRSQALGDRNLPLVMNRNFTIAIGLKLNWQRKRKGQ
ncbi:MAG: hypothetical protein AAGC88_09130 [Bacteroidota bacterium]